MDVIRAMSCYSPPNVAVAAPECREDRMVTIELEAAEALAGMAHSAVTENHGGDSAVIEPVKDDEMPPVYSEFESVLEPPNLAEGSNSDALWRVNVPLVSADAQKTKERGSSKATEGTKAVIPSPRRQVEETSGRAPADGSKKRRASDSPDDHVPLAKRAFKSKSITPQDFEAAKTEEEVSRLADRLGDVALFQGLPLRSRRGAAIGYGKAVLRRATDFKELEKLREDMTSPAQIANKMGLAISEDHENLQQKRHKKLHESISKPIKNEEFSEAEVNGTCTTSYVSSGLGKSRQYLTEADKEARRIRRVLANRESARQTIRRRQATFEELTRKAADLAWENENLKKEKELAVNEYDSLRNINKSLKAQITEVVKVVDAEEIHPEITPCLSENSPLLFSNQPAFFPFLWPQLVQHPNSFQIQCGIQGSVVFPSPSPMLLRNDLEHSSYDKGNSMITNSPGTPLYLLPCPWIFPLPHQQSHSHQEPTFNLNDKPNEIRLNTQYSPCSSGETVAHSEGQHLLPVKVNAEISIPQETLPKSDIHNNLFSFPPEGDSQQQGGSRARGNVLMPIPLRCVRSDINIENEVKSISTVASNIVSGVFEKSHEPMGGKKVEDGTAAAEARKRRKELTKLKNLNCRQIRMHYVEKG